jgi:hypothetical protein
LFYLVKSPQFVAFFERVGDARQEYEYLHLKTNWGTKIVNYRKLILLPGLICS